MPITTIEVHDLPERIQEMLEEARIGHEVIVTVDSLPRARLIPLPENKRRVLGLNVGTVQMADDFDAPLPEEFWTSGAP